MRMVYVFVAAIAASAAMAEEPVLPKFGPDATPIFQATAYLREAPAPDYWSLSAYYVPQQTTSDCSAAAVAMALNALRGLPPNADEELFTEASLIALVDDPKWTEQVADDGPGVTFDDLKDVLALSLERAGLEGAIVDAAQPASANEAGLAGLRRALADNETSAENVMLVYFNQGVITGDWDGPHISPVGAYDEKNDRVLIMDVDRNWYVPYWTSTETLLAALVKPIAEEHGPLAGGTGGYILVTKP